MPFKNKQKRRQYSKDYHLKLSISKKREYQNVANIRARKIKEFLANYKISIGCKDCGYKKHHSALDFDHISKKSLNVSFSKSISQAKKEIKKCEVVCANCHRLRTYKRLYPCKPDIFKKTYDKGESHCRKCGWEMSDLCEKNHPEEIYYELGGYEK